MPDSNSPTSLVVAGKVTISPLPTCDTNFAHGRNRKKAQKNASERNRKEEGDAVRSHPLNQL